MKSIDLSRIPDDFPATLRGIVQDKSRVIIVQNGQAVAAIISLDDLALLEDSKTKKMFAWRHGISPTCTTNMNAQ